MWQDKQQRHKINLSMDSPNELLDSRISRMALTESMDAFSNVTNQLPSNCENVDPRETKEREKGRHDS